MCKICCYFIKNDDDFGKHNENDLKQRGADNDIGRHAQNINHCRHHDKPAANPHNGRHHADEKSDNDRRNDADL